LRKVSRGTDKKAVQEYSVQVKQWKGVTSRTPDGEENGNCNDGATTDSEVVLLVL